MNKPDHTPSSRRTPYQRFSDKVFSITGMPVGRVLTTLAGILLLGWAILLATRGDEEQSADYKSKTLKKKDFLAAITVPDNFFNSAFPVQVDKLDSMVDRCDQLLNQKSEYSERVQEKRLTLLMLKSIIVAENGLDPTPYLELFQKRADQIAASMTPKDKHQYLVVSTYMKVLAADPDLDFYPQATAAISAIEETTPLPKIQASLCLESAMEYYEGSTDKAKAGKLLQLLGKKMAMSKEPETSDNGFSLLDYPNFSYCYRGDANITKLRQNSESETNQLLKQLEETPPQSLKTYNLLLNVPQQYLHVGNKELALSALHRLTAVASASDSLIRDHVLPQTTRLKTRIDMLNMPFPLSGFDIAGTAIEPTATKQAVILFYDPSKKDSLQALRRVVNSPLREGYSTATFFVPVEEPGETHIRVVQKNRPDTIVVDRPTAQDWLEKSGIEQVPYLIRLDKAGVVEHLGFP